MKTDISCDTTLASKTYRGRTMPGFIDMLIHSAEENFVGKKNIEDRARYRGRNFVWKLHCGRGEN